MSKTIDELLVDVITLVKKLEAAHHSLEIARYEERHKQIAVLEWYFRDGSVGGAEDPMYELMRAVGVTEEWLRRA
ncbi:MAG: hypothetical protein EBR82_89025 [Caulobacteraceae bacterium]|nr:hypothetical protein [Caulobacteraceae bacterium]